jgi:hypothetical protein
MKNKVKETISILFYLRALLFPILPIHPYFLFLNLYALPWYYLFLFNISPYFGGLLISAGIIIVLTYYQVSAKKITNKKQAISSGYRWSIKAALETPHPEGVIYILENTLKELNKFGINYQPGGSSYTSDDGVNDVKGFPNKTNLREAIDMAHVLSAEWSRYNAVERSRAMGEIRAKIQSEDMWLDWERIKLTKEQSRLDAYWFKYEN